GSVRIRVAAPRARAQSRGRGAERRGRTRALEVRGGAVPDEVLDEPVTRAAAGDRAAGERRAVANEGDLAAGCREVRRARGIRCGQRRADGGRRAELDEVVVPRLD